MNPKKKLKIAVDGPAASGKGTLARKIASSLGLSHLDTGKLYRAVGYKIINSGNSIDSKEFAISTAKAITLADTENSHLYDEGVGNAASIISAIPEVRAALLSFQKDFIERPEGAVLDGRDIGTVICPEADFKFFITADIKTRANRRFKQLQKEDENVIYNDILQDLQSRDERDRKRQVAPLKPAEDAICVDTTQMDSDEVLREVLSYICQEA